MKIKEYIQSKQYIKPNQDIKQRWESRIVARELHLQGVDGAEQYLTSYGKGISAAKVVMLARQAEDMGCLEMAAAFWSLAYRLEVGTEIDPTDWADYFGADFTVTARPNNPVEIVNDPNFPLNFQPGRLSPMQPEDARHEADFYINSPDYWGHPKRDGEKLIIFATKETVVYQSRSMKPAGAPSILFNQAILDAAKAFGAFILEGELYFVDVEGKEYQDSARCAARNIQLGQGSVKPVMEYSAFSCLYDGLEIAWKFQFNRVEAADFLMEKLNMLLPSVFIKTPLAKTTAEKQALYDEQVSQGREGEIWFDPYLEYHPGKSSDDLFVRTKHLTPPTTYVITQVYPGTAAGHYISGFDVSTLEGVAMGKIGTGYNRNQQREILTAHLLNPGGVKVVCVSRGFTVSGKLREGRFESLVESIEIEGESDEF